MRSNDRGVRLDESPAVVVTDEIPVRIETIAKLGRTGDFSLRMQPRILVKADLHQVRVFVDMDRILDTGGAEKTALCSGIDVDADAKVIDVIVFVLLRRQMSLPRIPTESADEFKRIVRCPVDRLYFIGVAPVMGRAVHRYAG